MSELTVKELDVLLETCVQLRERHDDLKARAAEVWKEYEVESSKLIAHLQTLERDEYRTKEYIFSYRAESSFKVPKDPEDREKFFEYLKAKGIYEEFVTVNHATLNAFAKQEEFAAEQSGILDFQIPGLTKSVPYFKPSIRKRK